MKLKNEKNSDHHKESTKKDKTKGKGISQEGKRET